MSTENLAIPKGPMLFDENAKRAASVDSGKRRKDKSNMAIDWAQSKIYQEVDMKSSRRIVKTYEDLDRKLKTMYPDSIYSESESRYL